MSANALSPQYRLSGRLNQLPDGRSDGATPPTLDLSRPMLQS
jgi:hypothetical protein